VSSASFAMVKLCRLQGTPFIVDTFWKHERAAYKFQPLFFLSHFHADHVSGIRDDWQAGPIFGTGVTLALLRASFPGLDPAIMVRDEMCMCLCCGFCSRVHVWVCRCVWVRGQGCGLEIARVTHSNPT
jgi:hypothetical protein